MTIAYVTLKVEPGKENEVAREIVKIKGVSEAAWTYGFCDILFKLGVESVEELDKVVLKKIRTIAGVRSSETMIVSPIPIWSSRSPRQTARKSRPRRRRGR
jgi:DNA-binding Lrp family transcriptional regulator